MNFDIKTRPNDDQILTQMRNEQAESQLPLEVRNFGVTIQKSTAVLCLFSLSSPKGTYDDIFLANYAYININDQLTRVPGIARYRFRSGPVCHAFLGEAGPACQTGNHRSGDS